jgi:hypothetical protein
MRHSIGISALLALCALLAGTAQAQSAADSPASADERLADLGRRLQRLQDANDVEALQRTYGYFVDKGMWTEISQLFAADGTYEIGGRGVFIGPRRVLEYLQVGLGAERPAEGRLINHMQFQPFVTVSADGTRAKIRMRAFVISNGGWGIPMYENEYVKEDGVWKISKLWGPFRMYTSAEGWAKSATPNTRPDSFPPPPDRLPSVVYLTYPSPYIVPFHFPHPVTGAPFKEPKP